MQAPPVRQAYACLSTFRVMLLTALGVWPRHMDECRQPTRCELTCRSHGGGPRVLTHVSGGSSRALESTCQTLDTAQTKRPGTSCPAVRPAAHVPGMHHPTVQPCLHMQDGAHTDFSNVVACRLLQVRREQRQGSGASHDAQQVQSSAVHHLTARSQDSRKGGRCSVLGIVIIVANTAASQNLLAVTPGRSLNLTARIDMTCVCCWLSWMHAIIITIIIQPWGCMISDREHELPVFANEVESTICPRFTGHVRLDRVYLPLKTTSYRCTGLQQGRRVLHVLAGSMLPRLHTMCQHPSGRLLLSEHGRYDDDPSSLTSNHAGCYI